MAVVLRGGSPQDERLLIVLGRHPVERLFIALSALPVRALAPPSAGTLRPSERCARWGWGPSCGAVRRPPFQAKLLRHSRGYGILSSLKPGRATIMITTKTVLWPPLRSTGAGRRTVRNHTHL